MPKPLRKLDFGPYSVQFTIREEGHAVWNRTCTDAAQIGDALEILRAMILTNEAAAELTDAEVQTEERG